mmetsp:Transcript_13684/g.31455  ORF Transcript_13684/g.31455 Transcript_13684/m.31455 type:complete len:280 (-) Transcript_13684:37-876(-)
MQFRLVLPKSTPWSTCQERSVTSTTTDIAMPNTCYAQEGGGWTNTQPCSTVRSHAVAVRSHGVRPSARHVGHMDKGSRRERLHESGDPRTRNCTQEESFSLYLTVCLLISISCNTIATCIGGGGCCLCRAAFPLASAILGERLDEHAALLDHEAERARAAQHGGRVGARLDEEIADAQPPHLLHHAHPQLGRDDQIDRVEPLPRVRLGQAHRARTAGVARVDERHAAALATQPLYDARGGLAGVQHVAHDGPRSLAQHGAARACVETLTPSARLPTPVF